MIKFLIDPFNILVLLIAASLIFRLFKWNRVFRPLYTSAAVWFLLISTPFLPSTVLNSLESRYDPVSVGQLDNTEEEFYIVVLGGGHGFDDRLPPNSLLSLNALGRLAEGIRLHRQLPNSRLVMSGFSASGGTTQAEMLKKTAILMGVEEEKVLMQKEPGNTFQEAKYFSERFTDAQNVLLITSAAHMPRAVMMFTMFDVKVIPSPTNYRLKGDKKISYAGFPSVNNIIQMRVGMNEYAGMMRYKIVSS